MELIFYVTLLLVTALSKASESLGEDSGNEGNSVNREDPLAFESFGSPVYGPSSIKSAGLDGKSAFNIPPPVLPASYTTYLSGPGYGNPYAYGPYSRLNSLPYTYPSAYGASLLNNPSAYGASLLNNPAYASALLSGLGYTGYGGSYFGRSAFTGLGYPGYPGLGYNFGGLGYPPAALRRGPAPLAGIPAPITGLSPTVPRAASAVAPIPAVPAFPNGFTSIRASDPAFYPYRAAAPLKPVPGKDGLGRYAYGSDGQILPVF